MNLGCKTDGQVAGSIAISCHGVCAVPVRHKREARPIQAYADNAARGNRATCLKQKAIIGNAAAACSARNFQIRLVYVSAP